MAALKAVQPIGGHTSSKTALRYQRADVDYLAAIAENVSALIESEANSSGPTSAYRLAVVEWTDT